MRKRFLLRAVLPGVATLVALIPVPARWVENVYSRDLYPMWQWPLTTISNLVPVALLDLLLLVAIGCAGWRVWLLVRVPRGRRLRMWSTTLADSVGVAAIAYVMFIGVWGCNYQRQPLTEKLDYHAERVTADNLLALARESVAQLNALHAGAHRVGWPALDRLRDTLGPSFHRLDGFLGRRRPTVLGRPKTTLLAPYFRSAAIDGMIDPFFLETLVNSEVLPFERPFLVAHEWAHLAGYADEGEANFLAWLVCLAGDEGGRYSAWLFLAPRLWRALPAAARLKLSVLEPGPRRDLAAIDERVGRAQPVVSRYARNVYDRFLKAHRVEAGVRSYDAVVRLVLGVRTDGQLE